MESMWGDFTSTGSVEDYLRYKQICYELAEDSDDANNDNRPSD